jgi:hypothetical protein
MTARIAFFGTLLAYASTAHAGLDPSTFQNPPADARPMTWMHMMNGNASAEGLVKDLQALDAAGVGGALIFSIKKDIADGDTPFNSEKFRDIIKAGAEEARRLGLKIGVHNCDGWSSSGGPWVAPEDAMKRVVWSEAVVRGGSVKLVLPQPAARAGFYRDIAVVAYPVSAAELAAFANHPTITGSCSDAEIAKLTDGTLDNAAALRLSANKEKPWIQLSFAHPFPARSIHIEHSSRNGTATLFASTDGRSFTKVADLKAAYRPGKMIWAFESSFPLVEARYFKIEFDSNLEVISLDLAPFQRLPSWLGQTAVVERSDTQIQALTPPPSTDFAPLSSVKVLTDALQPDGTLAAELPAGTWRIMRFGYTITGAYNHPATDVGRGWECDKFDASALDRHFAAYVGKLAQECGPLTGQSFYFSEIDSYEMGGQNWTKDFGGIFAQAKGYALTPYLPLLAGRLVGDADTANAVLGDFRNVASELMVQNYYARFTELCHRYGMKSYVEPYGNGIFDGLTAGGTADIPMGEFWMNQASGTHYTTPVSAAHTYGKPVISAESFTSWRDLNWKIHPWIMKESGDYAWTQGINEFMFHRFAHQANPHVAPGMTMDNIGSHIDRTQTWWLNAGKAWMKYLQRGQYLLRQGVPVSDLLVYVGEGSPHDLPTRKTLKLPFGYNFDHADTEVLLNRVSVKDGRLVLPEGTSYSRLLLANTEKMSLRVLQRVEQLLLAGATIIGPKPLAPHGLIERQTRQAEFSALAAKLWGNPTQPNRVGAGLMITGKTWPDSINGEKLPPDLLIKEEPTAAFVHRRIDGDELYFFHNREKIARTFTCSFRVADRIPELWTPDTGTVERLARFTQADGRTEVRITLDPLGSVFVVFRSGSAGLDPVSTLAGPDASARVALDGADQTQLIAAANGSYQVRRASGATRTVSVTGLAPALVVTGDWQVTFAGPGVKEPTSVLFDRLTDWKDHPREDIRHFSGTATYRRTISVPNEWFGPDQRSYLDLGQVEIAAEVLLNGHPVATLWKPPFVTDITAHLQPGSNVLEVRITNLWTNRLIGDEALPRTDGYKPKQKMPDWYVQNKPMPDGPRSTFTTFNFYDKDHTLLPSGLLGPVLIRSEARVPVR